MIESAPHACARPASAERARRSGEGHESTLFQAEGVLVTRERLVAHGRSWPLGEVREVGAVRQSPRVLPLLALLGGGAALGVPLLLAGMAAAESGQRGGHGAALAALGALLFAAMVRLVLMEDRYWLVLHTPARVRRVFHSPDPQLVAQVAAAVRAAAQAREALHTCDGSDRVEYRKNPG